MKYNKMNRHEKKINSQKLRDEAMHGSGIYVYQNNTKGDLDLPKATKSGKKSLRVGEQFQGDNYYMRLVQTNELRYIKCIVSADAENTVLKEEVVSDKLILNQPDRVTTQGKVEQVLVEPKQTLNENQPKSNKPKNDVLLTEDPMEGVEIILG